MMSLLLTDNASPGSSDGMMPGFLVEDGMGMENLVIVAISLNLLTYVRHARFSTRILTRKLARKSCVSDVSVILARMSANKLSTSGSWNLENDTTNGQHDRS